MKTNQLLSFIALAAGLASCQKKEELPECMGSCTIVSGRLLTSGSTPLPNTPVTLEWHGPFSGLRGEVRKKAVGTTDANGRYRLSAFLANDEVADGYLSVRFQANKSKYYLIGEPNFSFLDYKRDTLLTVPDYLIPRKAYLKLAVSNPSQIPNHGAFLSDFNNCYGGNVVYSSKIGGGGPVVFWDTLPQENPMEVSGDQMILIRHHKYNGGLLTHSTDSIFIPAGTTKTYVATY